MDLKKVTREKLLNVYHEYGMEFAIQVGYRALKSYRNKAELNMSEDTKRLVKTNINGEISETVLEIILLEYMRVHPIETGDWHLSKGLILKDMNRPKSKFLTELDLTLFTPKCVYVFECKSYAGDKRIIDKGTIIRLNGRSCDVFRQNSLHVLTLDSNIGTLCKTPIYQMKVFDFSRGQITDERDQKWKDLLPYTTIGDVLCGFCTGEDVWFMPMLLQAVKKLEDASERLRLRHLEYVRGLHGNE